MIEGKLWNWLIRENPIKKGDFFQVNPGCVYTIKGGTLILENQQSSDITYQLCDYDSYGTKSRGNFNLMFVGVKTIAVAGTKAVETRGNLCLPPAMP